MTGRPPAEAPRPEIMGLLSGGLIWRHARGVDFIFVLMPLGARRMMKKYPVRAERAE